MKFLTPVAGAAVLALMAGTHSAAAEECVFDKKIDDFEQADIDALYACIKDELPVAYAKQGHEIGSVYSEWKLTATGPAAPGAHSNRMLLTYANDIAYEQYVKYDEEGGFEMPVGSILAKESFSLTKKGKPRKGPLFTMVKVEAGGDAEEFDNWIYGGVQPNGKVMKVKQSFCHDCHVAFEDQDSLGYPDPDVRFEASN